MTVAPDELYANAVSPSIITSRKPRKLEHGESVVGIELLETRNRPAQIRRALPSRDAMKARGLGENSD
jgi:hypothetical protein